MAKSEATVAKRWSKAMVSLFLGAFWLGLAPAAAGEGLKNLIRDLYGPEGFVLEPAGAGPLSHRPHFSASSLRGLDSLNSSLAASVNTLSPSVAVGGFAFDVERGVPLAVSENLGPLLAERAETIGKGRLNIAATYTRVSYSKFQGTPLTNLSVDFAHEDLAGVNQPFENDLIHLNLNTSINQNILAFFGTYGLTDRWDVAMVVPLEHVSMAVTSDASVIDRGGGLNFHHFGATSSPQHLRVTDSASGLGDILLRTKYNFMRHNNRAPDLALVGQLRLPTGDENELLGTGDTSAMLLLVASKPMGRITPHVNLGYEATTGDSQENALHYVFGFDARIHPRLIAALEVLGLYRPRGSAIGDHIVDFAAGIKWNVFGDFLLSANVQVPLNKSEGLRADYIWSVGAEYTF